MSQDYSSSEEYEELEESHLHIGCLFCQTHASSHEDIWNHMIEQHQIHFIVKCRLARLDYFQYIKLVNYVRRHQCQPSSIDEVIQQKLFDTEEFLKPTLENDHLLMFDYEEDDNDVGQQEDIDYKLEYLKLKEQLARSEAKCQEMQASVQNNLIDDEEDDEPPKVEAAKVTTLKESNDQLYIDSYSHFSIHHEMLSDKPRTLAYQDAIVENGHFFGGKTVLDIGCGTAILSMFAAKAGARLVVAVDQSEIIYNATEIVHENQLGSIIKPVKGKLETIDFAKLGLPSKYDIIISEWMGYFLLFEGMIDTVLYARDHFLQDGGILLPNRCQMFMAALSDSNFYERNIDFWNDVYGCRMASMIKHVAREVCIEQVSSHNICSTTKMIAKLDVTQCSIEQVQDLSSEVELHFARDATVHALVGWFDCYFDSLQKSVVLSTSPNAEVTHWKQAIFPLAEPISIRADQTIKGTVTIKRDRARCLSVQLLLDSHNLALNYTIS